jgi:hypothetical protein
MPENMPKIRKKNREIFVSLLFFLSRKQKLALDHWLRGRKEYKEIKAADYVIISPPKCGRTWVRTMLSRFFQHRYHLPGNELLGFDNYHRMNPAIPRIRFTHDRYVNRYSGNRDSKRDYYDRKVILLVRDPRDVVASNYFQWINSVNPYKKKLLDIPDKPEEVPIFEYAMTRQFGIPRTVEFLQAWAPELDKTRAHLLIRYEDMRADAARTLGAMLVFMGIEATEAEIRQVVDETSFENMKKMEQNQTFDSGSRRLMIKDSDNPESFKVRRGKVGGYTDYFSEQEIEEIDRLIAQIPSLYGYERRGTLEKAGQAG